MAHTYQLLEMADISVFSAMEKTTKTAIKLSWGIMLLRPFGWDCLFESIWILYLKVFSCRWRPHCIFVYIIYSNLKGCTPTMLLKYWGSHPKLPNQFVCGLLFRYIRYIYIDIFRLCLMLIVLKILSLYVQSTVFNGQIMPSYPSLVRFLVRSLNPKKWWSD